MGEIVQHPRAASKAIQQAYWKRADLAAGVVALHPPVVGRAQHRPAQPVEFLAIAIVQALTGGESCLWGGWRRRRQAKMMRQIMAAIDQMEELAAGDADRREAVFAADDLRTWLERAQRRAAIAGEA